MKNSTNKRAEEIVGKRVIRWIAIDLPRELWYVCPVCKKKSEYLEWSEYNWFLRCGTCNKDYPSCLCCWKDIEKAINIYLDCMKEKWNQ